VARWEVFWRIARTATTAGMLFLVPGPFIGVIAMLMLRALPEATKIAQGRR